MGIDLEMDASIGIAIFPEHGVDADTLLRRADVALYLSKEAHAPCLYTEEQDHYSPERLALASDLRRAVTTDNELVSTSSRRPTFAPGTSSAPRRSSGGSTRHEDC